MQTKGIKILTTHNKRTNNLIKKLEEDTNRHVTKEYVQTYSRNKHEKRYSKLLATREMQLKPQ